MTLANKITLSRIMIMPIFIIGLETPGVFWRCLALLCFAYAAFSDWLDGVIARKYETVTDCGKFMDPLADKIFVCSAFISFVSIDSLNIPVWMAIVIISREFMITGLRTLAVSKGIVLPAQKLGKFKTTSQLVVICIILIILLIKDLIFLGVDFPDVLESYFIFIPLILTAIVTILTVFSGYSYIIQNKGLFNK